MLTIAACRDALVRQARTVKAFKQVEPYHINRTQAERFLKDLPALRLPACLIVFLGRTRTARGAGLDRVCQWTAVVIDRDPGGDAWQSVDDLVDEFEITVLDQQLLNDELTIHASSEVGVAVTDPRYAIYEVAFTTRELAAR